MNLEGNLGNSEVNMRGSVIADHSVHNSVMPSLRSHHTYEREPGYLFLAYLKFRHHQRYHLLVKSSRLTSEISDVLLIVRFRHPMSGKRILANLPKDIT